MLSQMSVLFAEDQKKHVLLREFYQFVRPQHKKEFDDACRSLTGVGCGYKPEHSLLREERLLLAKNAEKEYGKQTSCLESSANQLDSEQHLNKGGSHLTSASDATGENHACETGEPFKKPSSSIKESHSQRIRSAYLSDLKKSLDENSFSAFCSALSTYKKTDNYEAMVSVVAALTTEKTEHFHLLQRFSMFVRPHHKERFRQVCEELTGMSGPCEIEEPPSTAPEGGSTGMEGSDHTGKESKTQDVHESKTLRADSPEDSSVLNANLSVVSLFSASDVPSLVAKHAGKFDLCSWAMNANSQLTYSNSCWNTSDIKGNLTSKKCPQCQADTKRRHLAPSYWPDPR
ncbi:hypothetical protein JRQ81_014391 [Phrynocephalus forsythii]|uniref:Uncharacterized protein n=1 Tax=Phrynocephalus forsythii TaxID=171643 RepID=A0A9Q0XX85_9SAUR|nr:hypothetical protein JRQ81_014391 [Phrynocephalus forsythii]